MFLSQSFWEPDFEVSDCDYTFVVPAQFQGLSVFQWYSVLTQLLLAPVLHPRRHSPFAFPDLNFDHFDELATKKLKLQWRRNLRKVNANEEQQQEVEKEFHGNSETTDEEHDRTTDTDTNDVRDEDLGDIEANVDAAEAEVESRVSRRAGVGLFKHVLKLAPKPLIGVHIRGGDSCLPVINVFRPPCDLNPYASILQTVRAWNLSQGTFLLSTDEYEVNAYAYACIQYLSHFLHSNICFSYFDRL